MRRLFWVLTIVLVCIGCSEDTEDSIGDGMLDMGSTLDASIDGTQDAEMEMDMRPVLPGPEANLDFRVGYAEKALPKLARRPEGIDLAVCHGMRVPFGARAMAALSACRPKRVIFVGPSAGSLTKDVQALSHYDIVRVGVIDQTPGAPTSLSVCLVERRY